MTAASVAWVPWRRTARFAARLAGRHGAERGRRPSAGRVFVRTAAAAPRAWSALVSLRTRLELVLSRGVRRSAPTRRGHRHDVVRTVLARTAPLARRALAASPAAAGPTATAERMAARATRVERAGERPARATSRSAAVPAAPPVARVVRRASVAAATPPPADTGWGTPLSMRPAATPVSFPPAELERVAEHVIQTVNRRLHAHRERRGRS